MAILSRIAKTFMFFAKKCAKNLEEGQEGCTFAPAFGDEAAGSAREGVL